MKMRKKNHYKITKTLTKIKVKKKYIQKIKFKLVTKIVHK